MLKPKVLELLGLPEDWSHIRNDIFIDNCHMNTSEGHMMVELVKIRELKAGPSGRHRERVGGGGVINLITMSQMKRYRRSLLKTGEQRTNMDYLAMGCLNNIYNLKLFAI